MKAVIPCVMPGFLAERTRLGHDQYDEMWDGVLHIPPLPTMEQQELESDLLFVLKEHWERRKKAKVIHQVNLALPGAGYNWRQDYRTPDIVLFTSECLARINCDSHCEGAPTVVVEIHRDGDEAYEKLPFYGQLQVPEVWIIDRDTKTVEIYLLREGKLMPTPAGADGWMRSPSTGVEMRPAPDGKLSIRLDGDEKTRKEIPGKP